MMGGEGCNSWQVPRSHLNLIRHRIRFEIDQTTHLMVLGPQFLGPTEIEGRIRFAVEAAQAREVAGSTAPIGPARVAKNPAIIESQKVHLTRQIRDVGLTLERRPIRRWMVDRPVRILDVPHVKAQASYTSQMMEHLPGHPSKRRRRQ
jgi:hypothetical protein